MTDVSVESALPPAELAAAAATSVEVADACLAAFVHAVSTAMRDNRLVVMPLTIWGHDDELAAAIERWWTPRRHDVVPSEMHGGS